MCTDTQTERKSDYLISTSVHYVHLGGNNDCHTTQQMQC